MISVRQATIDLFRPCAGWPAASARDSLINAGVRKPAQERSSYPFNLSVSVSCFAQTS
jgi:hypothetical protein